MPIIPLISVIVPVYNAAPYLRRGIDSLLAQTWGNLEIILIDDGSTDGSGNICDEYVARESCVKALHKENGGVSSARNMGLGVATGDYIGFLDPDDFAEPGLFGELCGLALETGAEAAICGHYIYIDGKLSETRVFPEDAGVLKRGYSLHRLIAVGTYEGFLWNKLFSVGLINRAGQGESLRFDENIHMCEDLLFCCKCLLAAQGIAYLPKPLYHYMITDGGLSHSFNLKKRLTEKESWEQVAALLPPELSQAARERLHTVVFNILRIAVMTGTRADTAGIKKIAKVYLREYLRSPDIKLKNKLRAFLLTSFPYFSGLVWDALKKLFKLRWPA